MEATQTIESILAYCAKEGLDIDASTLAPLDSAGFMSRVLTARSDKGEVVITIVAQPVPEQLYQGGGEKILKVGRLLAGVPQIPHIYLTGPLPNKGYFIVQERKPGTPLGRRVYSGGTFVDEFLVEDPQRLVEELEEVILQIHEHRFTSFGYIDLQASAIQGSHASWPEFLLDNFKRNISMLEAAEASHGVSYFSAVSADEFRRKIEDLLSLNRECFEIESASLIHGDVLNYSNVLVEDGKVTGVVDLEWALLGHPAWEFVFRKQPPIGRYVPLAKQKGLIPPDIDFKRSVALHNIFWCAWGASVHATNPEFGSALFKSFITSLQSEV
ncbi:MAG: phosphotransferase [Patescibacteria group bacterium]